MYRDYTSDALLAEELGFDFSWYGEHHNRPCDWTPSPLTVCAHVAARTKRLRVGTQVLCLPFHNPLRVAEDVAVIDIMSNGRFDLGVGVGSQYEEFVTFGIDPKEMHGRTWESIDVIQKCFESESPFTHEGRHYTFKDVDFRTKPVQKPFTIWWGGFGPKNTAKAAQRGLPIQGGRQPLYDREAREAGLAPDKIPNSEMIMCCLGDTAEQAWNDSIDGLHYFMNFYVLRRELDGTLPPRDKEITKEMIRAGEGFMGKPIVGTVESTFDEWMALKRRPHADKLWVAIAPRHAGMSTEAAHRTIRLFAKHIAPALKK